MIRTLTSSAIGRASVLVAALLVTLTVIPAPAHLMSKLSSLRSNDASTSEAPQTVQAAALRSAPSNAPKAAQVTYTTIANGNWSASTTWLAGSIPGSTINAADTVNIGHIVTYDLSASLRVSGTVIITNGTFRTALTGSGENTSVFIDPGGDWIMLNSAMFLPIFSCGYGCSSGSNKSGNFINKNGNINIVNSKVEIAQNWEDTSDPGQGTRTLRGGCLRIGENFLNKGSVDLYDATCIELGLHGSGNWKNEYQMTFQNSSIVKLVGNGNLENVGSSPSGVFGGPGPTDLFALGISSGSVTNDRPWSAQVQNYCNLPSGTVGGSMAADFNDDVPVVQNCAAVNAVNCNSCAIPDVLDYGDAPNANYQTSLASNGASHIVSTALFIGSASPATDGEADSTGNPAADVDDTTPVVAGDDETFLGTLSIAQSATTVTLIVPVTNTTGAPAKLCGWIDFNIDTDFDAPSEGRCATVPTGGATTATLTWNAISFSAGTFSYLRLRISANTVALTESTPGGPQTANGEVEDHRFTISNVTAVNLASFNAYQLGDSVFIDWKTGYEADNLGFNLYRDSEGGRVQVTPSMLAGSALMVGSGVRLEAGLSYAWRDDAGGDAASAQYWLEEVDLHGGVTAHGPFNVSSGDSLPLEKRRHLASQRRALPLSELADRLNPMGVTRALEPSAELAFTDEKTTTVSATRTAGAARIATPARSATGKRIVDLSGQSAVKIEVKRAGWYRVPKADLVAAGLGGSVDPRNFQLYADGKQVPIRVTGEADGSFDSGDAVEFYGVGLDIPSTDGRVYWLMASRLRGQRMPSSGAGGGGSPPPSFSHTVVREDRLVYVSAILNGDAENFFGMPLANSIPSVTQTLAAPNLFTQATGDATLEVALQGVSNHAHSVKVSLNGIVLGTIDFAGQAQGVHTFHLPNSQLVAGDNLVKLEKQSPEPDVSAIDFLRLTYQHSWKADGNALLVEAQSGQQVSIGGFTGSNVRILDITNPDSPVELSVETSAQQGGFTATSSVNGGAGTRRLYAFTADLVRAASSVEGNQPSAWKRQLNGADFLVISHSTLIPAVQPLVELRRRQGLRVVVIDVEDLYDEFAFGSKTPEAISDFIHYAASSWKIKPTAVMFVGKGTYDPRFYLGQGDADLVPTQMMATETMESAVDDSLADFDGDGVPELAVGRLPVRSAAEASALVGKIISYEGSPASNRVTLISDISDTFGFDGVNDQLQAVVPTGVQIDKISRGQLGDSQARTRVLEALDRANKIVSYVGHGSIELWRGNILTTGDSPSLRKGGELSLFVMMTCLNGYFISPLGEGLGESLLRSQGGAVAVWASSGTTTPEGQAVMNVAAFQQLFGPGNLTIGEAARAAKAAVGEPDVRRTWNLLGDPTMRLK